jgi:hypothetical protein
MTDKPRHFEDGEPAASARPQSSSRDAWERELSRAAEREGVVGSIEPELEIAALLGHARGPEPAPQARIDDAWREIETQLHPTRARVWKWLWLGGGLVAAAAALVLVVVVGFETHESATEGGHAALSAADLSAQFELLLPAARERVEADVESKRSMLRRRLTQRAKSMGEEP